MRTMLSLAALLLIAGGRLRRKVGGDGWEITSASLQPALD